MRADHRRIWNATSAAIIIATLAQISANQPSAVTGGCQFQSASAARVAGGGD